MNKLSNKLDNLFGFKLYKTGIVEELNADVEIIGIKELAPNTWGRNALEIIVTTHTTNRIYPNDCIRTAKFALMRTHQGKMIKLYDFGKASNAKIIENSWNPSISINTDKSIYYSIYIMELINI